MTLESTILFCRRTFDCVVLRSQLTEGEEVNSTASMFTQQHDLKMSFQLSHTCVQTNVMVIFLVTSVPFRALKAVFGHQLQTFLQSLGLKLLAMISSQFSSLLLPSLTIINNS